MGYETSRRDHAKSAMAAAKIPPILGRLRGARDSHNYVSKPSG